MLGEHGQNSLEICTVQIVVDKDRLKFNRKHFFCNDIHIFLFLLSTQFHALNSAAVSITVSCCSSVHVCMWVCLFVLFCTDQQKSYTCIRLFIYCCDPKRNGASICKQMFLWLNEIQNKKSFNSLFSIFIPGHTSSQFFFTYSFPFFSLSFIYVISVIVFVILLYKCIIKIASVNYVNYVWTIESIACENETQRKLASFVFVTSLWTHY